MIYSFFGSVEKRRYIMSLQNSVIFELFRNSDNKSAFELAILRELHILADNAEANGDLKRKLHHIYFFIKKKWQTCNRTKDTFLKKNSKWLIEFTCFKNLQENSHKAGDGIKGRPTKPLEDCSSYTRKRKLHNATQAISTSGG